MAWAKKVHTTQTSIHRHNVRADGTGDRISFGDDVCQHFFHFPSFFHHFFHHLLFHHFFHSFYFCVLCHSVAYFGSFDYLGLPWGKRIWWNCCCRPASVASFASAVALPASPCKLLVLLLSTRAKYEPGVCFVFPRWLRLATLPLCVSNRSLGLVSQTFLETNCHHHHG